MNKNIWIVLGIVVILIIVLVFGKNKQEQIPVNNIGENETQNMMADDAFPEEASSGSYEAYGLEKLALADSGDVVLFFRASWCPTCRTLDADIKANIQNIPTGVTILDVNYDDSTTLKQKYGVTYQHTLVQVDSSGNQIAKWMGSPTLASLVANIK